MPELLQNYSIEQIIIFIVVLAIAIKWCGDFFDWVKGKLDKIVNKQKEEEKEIEKVNNIAHTHQEDMEMLMKIQDTQNEAIDKLFKSVEDLVKANKLQNDTIEQNREALDSLKESVHLLLASDKDDIKAWITEKHHYFVYELKYIDDYSLDCIEKRYAHYKDEGGNSFVADLMRDIRSLPKVNQPIVHNQDNDTKK